VTIYVKMNPLERLRQRPMEHLAAYVFFLAGATRLGGHGPFANELTGVSAFAWSTTLIISAGFILFGLHWRGDPIVRAVLESIGWYLGIAAGVGGPFLLWLGGNDWDYQWSDDFFLAVTGGLRIWYLSIESRGVREIRNLELGIARGEEEDLG